jgi:hypothetical protein
MTRRGSPQARRLPQLAKVWITRLDDGKCSGYASGTPFNANRMNRRLLWAGLLLLLVATTGVWLLAAPTPSSGSIGPNSAAPSYIVVDTPTEVTFTSVITDSKQLTHHPNKVLLVRIDASGKPIDIVGRMRDNGKKGDAERKDFTFTLKTTLNEPTVGAIQFRLAAKFKQSWVGKDPDGDDDWDGDLTALGVVKDKLQKRDRLTRLLKRLERYSLSQPITIIVDPFKLPPDPGEVGKQTLVGIDSDNDGVRDDVQRYLALAYGTSNSPRAALTQIAQGLNDVLADINLGSDPVPSILRVLEGNDCLMSVRGVDQAADDYAALRARQFDTLERSLAWNQASQQFGGHFVAVTPIQQRQLKCVGSPSNE